MNSSIRVSTLTGLLGTLLMASPAPAAELFATAAHGSPFGVARLILTTDEEIEFVDDIRCVHVREASSRALYTVVSSSEKSLPELKKRDTRNLMVHFVFRGEEPLEVTLTLRDGRSWSATVTPKSDAVVHEKLVDTWWQRLCGRAQTEWRDGQLTEGMDRYLLAMLARRLELELPEVPGAWDYFDGSDLFLSVLTGSDSIRAAMQSKTYLAGSKRRQRAVHPLPEGVDIPAVPVPEYPDDVAIEPIAMHVPKDCFYIRAGNYQNFLWLRSNVDVWASRARDLALRRPLDMGLRAKLERQLALQETEVARLFGDAIVSDVALIGADTFLREGAALGVLFEAKNSQLLAAEIYAQRAHATATVKGAREQNVELATTDASLLSTPDNSVRSYYVADGDYHLVTNSETIARDFVRAGAGVGSLGALDEFRHARHLMPETEDQTIFAYMSDDFFRRLISPQYRVEMTRRNLAMSEIETVEFARLAATAENRRNDSVDELIDNGFLFAEFTTRPDGSYTQVTDGLAVDSYRGAHGCFVPVADVRIDGITESERKGYEKFTRMYSDMWRRVDPVSISVSRKAVAPDRERVIFDIHITPVMQQRIGLAAAFLAPPVSRKLAPIDGDLLSFELVLNGPVVGNIDGNVPQDHYRIFGGLRHAEFPFKIEQGEVHPEINANWEPAYIGSTPPIFLFGQKDGEPDEDGYFNGPEEQFLKDFIWGRKFDEFRVRSPQREVLESVTPQLQVVDAERAAQIRLEVDDARHQFSRPLALAHGYTWTRQMSARGSRFLNRLSDNLALDPDEAPLTAERLLHARLACPMGGQYQLAGDDPSFQHWTSTTWRTDSLRHVDSVPADFRFPLLEWFHGLSVELSVDRTTLRTHVELETSPTPLQTDST